MTEAKPEDSQIVALADARRRAPAIDDPREQAAVALLHDAGWSIGALKMTFQASEGAIRQTIARVKDDASTTEGDH